MKNSMQSFFEDAFSYGLATTSLVAGSFRDSIVYGFSQIEKEEEKPYDAQFKKLEDIASPTGDGLCINGTSFLRSKEASARNLLISGGTGSGKSSIIAACNLLTPNGQNFIVHDPSSQLKNLCADYLQKKGYRIYVLDFNDPEHSDSLNLFDFIKTKADANKLAVHLVRSTMGTGASDRFWELSCCSLIRLLIELLFHYEKKYQTMQNVKYLLEVFAGEPELLDRLVVKSKSDEIYREYKALIRGNEKTLSSIIMSAQAALELWNDEVVCKLTSKTSIDFEAFRKEQCALFLINATFDAAYYKSLLSVVINNMLKIYMSKLPDKTDKRITFLLDECATLNLESLDQVVSNNRKYALNMMLFFQNLSQVYHAFGQDAGSNLLANCYTKIFLNTDLRASNDLEILCGKRSIVDARGNEQLQPLITAQNIRWLSSDEAIMLYGNHPYRIPMTPFYKQPLIKRRASQKPYIHSPKISFETNPLIPLP